MFAEIEAVGDGIDIHHHAVAAEMITQSVANPADHQFGIFPAVGEDDRCQGGSLA
jgi:hypothetical protein